MNDKFVQVKNSLLESLDGTTLKVFCILLSHSNSNCECYPSIRRIEEKYNISNKTIQKSIDKLISLKIISKKNRETTEGKRISNLYVINRDYVVENEKKKKRIISLPDWFNKNLERKELDIEKKEEIERMLKEFN